MVRMEESKAAVIAREEDSFRRRIHEALEILFQSPTLNRDRGFKLPALKGDVLTRDLFHQAHVTNRFLPHSVAKNTVTASKACDR